MERAQRRWKQELERVQRRWSLDLRAANLYVDEVKKLDGMKVTVAGRAELERQAATFTVRQVVAVSELVKTAEQK